MDYAFHSTVTDQEHGREMLDKDNIKTKQGKGQIL